MTLADRHLALSGLTELAAEIGAATAGRTGRDALLAAATTYRSYARRHPASYAAIQQPPDPADAELTAAGDRLVVLFFAVLRGYGLDPDRTVHATRAVRSSLHGFVDLEATRGFGLPQDADDSFAQLVDLLDAGLSSRRRP